MPTMRSPPCSTTTPGPSQMISPVACESPIDAGAAKPCRSCCQRDVVRQSSSPLEQRQSAADLPKARRHDDSRRCAMAAQKKGARITGAERTKLATELTKQYAKGKSISRTRRHARPFLRVCAPCAVRIRRHPTRARWRHAHQGREGQALTAQDHRPRSIKPTTHVSTSLRRRLGDQTAHSRRRIDVPKSMNGYTRFGAPAHSVCFGRSRLSRNGPPPLPAHVESPGPITGQGSVTRLIRPRGRVKRSMWTHRQYLSSRIRLTTRVGP